MRLLNSASSKPLQSRGDPSGTKRTGGTSDRTSPLGPHQTPVAGRIFEKLVNSWLAFYCFLLGMTTTTISVKMLKNKPRIRQPNGLRPSFQR